MPLHVDRSSISLDHAQRREWSIERAQPDVAAGDGRPAPAAEGETVDVAAVKGARTTHPEVARIEQAEDLVRRLVAAGTGLKGVHAAADPARASQLISD